MPVPHHTSSTPAQPPALDSAHTDAVLDPKPLSAELQAKEPGSQGPLLKHINFWLEDELKMAHPEVQASINSLAISSDAGSAVLSSHDTQACCSCEHWLYQMCAHVFWLLAVYYTS